MGSVLGVKYTFVSQREMPVKAVVLNKVTEGGNRERGIREVGSESNPKNTNF